MARINFVEKTVNKKCHHFLGGMTIYNWYYHFQIFNNYQTMIAQNFRGLLISVRLLYSTIRLTIQENDNKIKHLWLVF